MMTIGSLFTGYGGLDLAVESVLDARTVWTSDIDSGARKIIAHRFPHAPNLGDITQIDWADVPPVDIITGGSPCQDLSHAGKRQGMKDGTRSNLWAQMREAIRVIQPKLVVWENVRGALSAEADSEVGRDSGLLVRAGQPTLRALGRVLGDLAGLGYDARWHGLRAADVGAPHGRFRVFLVAYPAADAGCTDRWGTDTGRRDLVGRNGSSTRRIQSAGAPVGSSATALLPTPGGYDGDRGGSQHPDKRRNGNHSVSLQDVAEHLLPTPMAGDAKAARNSTAVRRCVPPTGIHAGDTLSDIAYADRWAQYGNAVRRWEGLTRPAPEPTEPNRKGGRRLAPAFPEWMMGLPAGWITDVPGITRNEALKAAGNGVVPQQAIAALQWLLADQLAVAA